MMSEIQQLPAMLLCGGIAAYASYGVGLFLYVIGGSNTTAVVVTRTIHQSLNVIESSAAR
jgi:hypothetical protein